MIYIPKYIINASVLINMHDDFHYVHIQLLCCVRCYVNVWKTKYFWFPVENNKIISECM